MNEQTKPILSFGVITDVQYAMEPATGFNYKKTKQRFYRAALDRLKTAVSTWKRENVDFVLQLGDLIDGCNRRYQGHSQQALDACLAEFKRLPDVQVHHLIGNHELYNFHRSVLSKSPLNTSKVADAISPSCAGDGLYYHFSPAVGFRIVVIDPYEISCLGYPQDSEQYRYAHEWLCSYNKNQDLNDDTGLPDGRRMMVRYNGAVSEAQLGWLDDVLTEAERNEEMVLIASHMPIHHQSCDVRCTSWNAEEILSVLHKHRSCVLAYFAGHNHDRGYTCDEAGIHHVTFEGVIETSPDTECFATVSVYQDRLEVKGASRINNYTLRR